MSYHSATATVGVSHIRSQTAQWTRHTSGRSVSSKPGMLVVLGDALTIVVPTRVSELTVDVVVDVVDPVALSFPLELPEKGSLSKLADHHSMNLSMVEKYCIQFEALMLLLSLSLGSSLAT